MGVSSLNQQGKVEHSVELGMNMLAEIERVAQI